jgi:hypothetical protein
VTGRETVADRRPPARRAREPVEQDDRCSHAWSLA